MTRACGRARNAIRSSFRFARDSWTTPIPMLARTGPAVRSASTAIPNSSRRTATAMRIPLIPGYAFWRRISQYVREVDARNALPSPRARRVLASASESPAGEVRTGRTTGGCGGSAGTRAPPSGVIGWAGAAVIARIMPDRGPRVPFLRGRHHDGGPDQALRAAPRVARSVRRRRADPGARRPDALGPGRRDLRLPGPERRRQEHGDPPLPRLHPPDGGSRARPGPRCL